MSGLSEIADDSEIATILGNDRNIGFLVRLPKLTLAQIKSAPSRLGFKEWCRGFAIKIKVGSENS
jgi:hypothetical protein